MNDYEKQFEDFTREIKFDDGPDNAHRDRLEQELLGALAQQTPRQKKPWRTIMKSRSAKLAAAAAIILAVILGLHGLVGDGTGIAFGQILDNLRSVQTLHARINKNGRVAEIWGKRPNMLRMEYEDGKYEISNGAKMWSVDPANKKATLEPSRYFKYAQRHGVDVVNALVEGYTNEFSGFFSEEPIKQISQNDESFDLYQMELDRHDDARVEFEALVHTQTHLLHSLRAESSGPRMQKQVFELTVLEYDQPIPEKLFVFEPDETIQVIVKEDEEPEPSEPVSRQVEGSTLSGRITWASSGKPVFEARLTVDVPVYGPNGRYQPSLSFKARAETNREGYWQINGVPSGEADICIRSWELDWPAVPTFATYAGSPRNPRITVDGQSGYDGLDFKVYKPADLYSRITVTVTDEDDNTVTGASGSIIYDDTNDGDMHRHLYAGPHQQYTGPDGKFDTREIWPSTRLVRVCVGAGSAYSRWGGRTEPFVIKPGQSHHFDIVLPYSVQMNIQVVDPENKPLEGILVRVLDTQWLPVHVDGPERPLFTDSDGLVEADAMDPAENVIIAVRRVLPEAGRLDKTLASLFIPAVAPSGRDKPIRRVVFDERPISIEGTCDSTFEAQKRAIYVMPAGLPRYRRTPYAFLTARFDDTGRFLLEGVPAGDILLVCKDWASNKTVAEQTIRTEPGKTYTLKVGSRGLELIGQKRQF
ncbi:MAG: LolA family protein [Planctomycetota bacterium]|jgi:outer membrane lipoprotein-sorting protein